MPVGVDMRTRTGLTVRKGVVEKKIDNRNKNIIGHLYRIFKMFDGKPSPFLCPLKILPWGSMAVYFNVQPVNQLRQTRYAPVRQML